MKPVQTKADFVERFVRMEFGNRTQVWESVEEYLLSDYKGLVHLRNRIVGGPTWYGLKDKEELVRKWNEAIDGGTPPSQWYVGAMIPPRIEQSLLIQGEVQQSVNHIDLFYSTVPEPMRPSLLKGGKQVSGIRAIGLLKKYLDPMSYDWIQELLEVYPGHVVEFSTYATNHGILRGLNSIVWEVRNY